MNKMGWHLGSVALQSFLGGKNSASAGRRIILLSIIAALFLPHLQAEEPFFNQRGYYITFMRTPTLGLEEWKRTIDYIQSDGANLVILWMGGAFRSKKFPITWLYNADHKNVQQDFVRELIDYAHQKNIKVTLGFTPFGYDGVNQYALEHPELKGIQENGNFIKMWGMHAWGYPLNPYRPEAQQFMLEYVREMFFDFYPNADGLFIESADYMISQCKECREPYYSAEFRFVRRISDEIWRAKPDATIIVYPTYFSGKTNEWMQARAMRAEGTRETLDPRWTVFFTPHSTALDAEVIGKAKSSLYWTERTILGLPPDIQAAAQVAARNKTTGFVPALEAYTFANDRETGGRRLKPFGFGWLANGANPFGEILVRVNRIAYREFARNPDLRFAEYRRILGEEIFGEAANDTLIDDLLFVQECFFLNRDFNEASALVSPISVKRELEAGRLGRADLENYRERLRRLAGIERRYREATNAGVVQMRNVAKWVTDSWKGPEGDIIERHLR